MRPRPLVALASLITGLLGCGDPPPAPGELQHVLLISLDTTRADHLGCYGDSRGLTPRLDGLAAQGLRFASCTAPAPTTLASHTSLLTGCYPQTHGVARNGFVVHPDNHTLAELLAEHGWHTAAFLGSFALGSRFGLDQGFRHYDEAFDLEVEVGRDQNQRRAAAVTDAVLEHLDGPAGRARNAFLFAHYFDAHVPYAPPAPFDTSHTPAGSPRSADSRAIEAAVVAHQEPLLGQAPGLGGVIGAGLSESLARALGEPAGSDEALAGLYAGEVAYMDREIGRLLDGLANRGLLDNTLVIVTGDHGETFWEHGDFWNHGLWVYETTVAVPLILRFPDGRAAGEVVPSPVSTIDLLPTMCEVLELPLPERAEGVSLASSASNQGFRRGPVFTGATQPLNRFEEGNTWPNASKPSAVRDGPWKYVQAPYLNLEQLFHLGDDPGERNDLLRAPSLSNDARSAHARLKARLRSFREGADPLPSHFDDSQLRETILRLQQLGYSGANDQDRELPRR